MNKCLRLSVLVFLLFAGCELDPLPVIFHPNVETRVKESFALDTIPTAPISADTFRFAVFGDVHIGKPSGSYLPEFIRAADSLGIDFFCVAGDLTDHGAASEYDSVKTLLSSIAPYLVTIGNHDLYRSNSWEQFKKSFGPSCYSISVNHRLKLIFLDTGEGRLGANQFDWLKDQLGDSAAIKLVITHFPIYDDQTPSIFRLASAAERQKLLSLLKQYRVYAYCAGHIHGFRHNEIAGVNHFICGTMSKSLDFGEPGFLLFCIKADSITWQFVRFSAQQ